jgi:WD40 repeat protein
VAGEGEASAPSFSADGSLVAATWNGKGTIRIADPRTGGIVRQLGSLTVSTGAGPADPSGVALREPLLILRGHTCRAGGLAFSPDGTRLASRAYDGIRIWALDIDDLLDIARRNVTRSLTDAECRRYLHLPGCPAV